MFVYHLLAELFDFPLPGDIAASIGEISLLSADSGCIISLSVELYPPTKIFTISFLIW